MRHRLLPLICCTLLSAAMIAEVRMIAQQAEPPSSTRLPPVRAELETEFVFGDGRRVVVAGTYHRSSDGRVREEQGDTVTVADIKKARMTIFNKTAKEAMVFQFDPATKDPTPRTEAPGRPVLRGVYEEFPVSKVRAPLDDGAEHEMWTATDLGLIVYGRVGSPQLTTTKRLKNIKLAEPEEELFEVPAGYRSVERKVPPPKRLEH